MSHLTRVKNAKISDTSFKYRGGVLGAHQCLNSDYTTMFSIAKELVVYRANLWLILNDSISWTFPYRLQLNLFCTNTDVAVNLGYICILMFFFCKILNKSLQNFMVVKISNIANLQLNVQHIANWFWVPEVNNNKI